MLYNRFIKGKRVNNMKGLVSNSAQRLQELINVLGISQAEFCRTTGLDKSTVSLYLNGKRIPRQDKLTLISSKFHVDPAWLMGFDVPMTKESHDALAGLSISDTIFIDILSKLDSSQRNELISYATYLLDKGKKD